MMDETAMMTAMKASISDVLERMFFLPFNFDESDAPLTMPASGPSPLIARLAFDGQVSGLFMLMAPDELARSITADFLGLPRDSVDVEQVGATVLEMVNMLAGACLSHYDQHLLFDLQIPELVQFDSAGNAPAGTRRTLAVAIETRQNRLSLVLHVTAHA